MPEIVETPPDAPAIPVSAEDLVPSLIAGMPEVTGKEKTENPVIEKPEFIGPTQPEIKPVEQKQTIFPPDDRGNPFDPFTHKADENGIPLKNKKGMYYSKFIGRGGAQKKAVATGVAPSPIQPTNSNPPNEDFPAPEFKGVEGGYTPQAGSDRPEEKAAPVDEATGVAMLAVPTFDGLMQTLFTNDVALTSEEMARINPFAANYIRSKGLKDVPPLAALSLILIATYAPKFTKPTVKERCVLFYLKIKNLFIKAK